MDIDEAKFSRAIALARGATGARVTAYNKATAMDAVNHAIDVFLDLRMEIAGYGQPASNESGAGHGTSANMASSQPPTRSLQNSEEGARNAVAGNGQSSTASTSLPLGDGAGRMMVADDVNGGSPTPSPSEPHSGAGQVCAANKASSGAPAPAVVPSAAQRAANIASRLQTADTILDTWKISGIALGDIRYAALVRMRSDHIRGAAESIRVAGVLDLIHKRSGIPYDKGMQVRDLVSAADVEAMLDEVNTVTAAVLRPVVREMRRQSFKLRSPA